MGGRGSGRDWSVVETKQLVERCVSLNPNQMLSPQVDAYLKQHRIVTSDGTSARETVVTCALALDAWGNYWVELSGHGSYQRLRIAKARFGFGYRFLVQCECGRPCVKLYWPPDAYAFGCRLCYRLAYRSSNRTRTKRQRLLNRAARYGRMEDFL